MKLLLISNSFGVNLQTYATEIAKVNGFDLDIYTLYIGGCSLDTHVRNIEQNKKDYELFANGVSLGKFVSIKEALELDTWDIISLQQASHYSGEIETYYPYFEYVLNFVRKYRPNSKIVFHKTWAYSNLNPFKYQEVLNWYSGFKFKNYNEMKKGIDCCCDQITKEFGIDTVINSGDVVDLAMNKIGDCYDSQGFHMNKIGCYLIGLNLVKILFDRKIEKVFTPEDMSEQLSNQCVNFINSNF